MNTLNEKFSLRIGQPSYQRIREWLLEKLVEEDWQVGSRIPGEAALAKQFGTSAMPIRQALQGLADEGYLVRHRGKGTFVTKLPGSGEDVADTLQKPDTLQGADRLRGKRIVLCAPVVHNYYDPSARLLALTASIESRLEQAGAEIRYFEFQEPLERCGGMAESLGILDEADGVMLFHPLEGGTDSEDPFIYELINRGIPTVAYDYHGHAPVDRVEVDEFSASKLLLEHLMETGCSRILFCATRSSLNKMPSWLENRIQGFMEAAASLGIPFSQEDVLVGTLAGGGEGPVADATELLQSILKQRKGVDAIVACNDKLALGIRQAFRNLKDGPPCPRIAGFDNTYHARISGLTTLGTPADDMSLSAVQLLWDRIVNQTPCTYRRVFHLSELLVRESTRPVSAKEPARKKSADEPRVATEILSGRKDNRLQTEQKH